MDPTLAAGAIAGGGSVLSSLIGAGTAFIQQKKANQFNVDMWNRQNLYNSPREQMKRLQEAGLNPNLIYGNGSAGTGNAGNAPQFEKLSEHGYRPVDIPSALQSITSVQDFAIKKATEDKLRTQIELDKQRALLTGIEATGKIMSNERLRAQLPYAAEVAKTQLEALQLGNRNLMAQTQKTITDTEIAQMKNVRDTASMLAELARVRAGINMTEQQTRNLRLDQEVKELDAKMAQMGIRPGDHKAWKMLEDFLETMTGYGLQPDKKDNTVWNLLKKLF